MSKLRVYELARELSLTNKRLMEYFANNKICVVSHMSCLDFETVEHVRASVEKIRTEVKFQRHKNITNAISECENNKKPTNSSNSQKHACVEPVWEYGKPITPLMTCLDDLAVELCVEYKVLRDQVEKIGLRDSSLIVSEINEGKSLLRLIYSNPNMSQLAAALDLKSETLIKIINSYGMRIKTDCVPVDKSLVFRMFEDHPELLLKDIKREKTTGENAHQLKFDPVKNKTFILDASNICRGFSQKKGTVTIIYLLSLAVEILGRGGYFFSVFDSNAEYSFKEKKADELKYYNNLIYIASDYFCVSTGGLRADEFILQMANEDNYDVISNDRFRDYIAKYPWISDSPERLNKGKITPKLNNGKTIGYRISIPSLNINADIKNNIENLTKDVISRLN